ncbi:ATP-dependent DNA helicase DDX11 [Rhipicephalus microplus]|uniref:ATP-dependent DNA helicase DDX11 n=1 Tax=Rhipicephalus microplus TaxID=6941 RepID=UPI003F6C9DEC
MQSDVNFHFPFEPYPVQRAFMKALFTALSESKVGIFESPTGTGKSLSILCGALAWLNEYKASKKCSMETELADLRKESASSVDSGNDWFIKCAQKRVIDQQLREVECRYKALMDKEKKYKDHKENVSRRSVARDAKAKIVSRGTDDITKDAESIAGLLAEINEDQEDIVGDYDSDDETARSIDGDEVSEALTEPKIIYCSRTHSQLTQFVRELKKTVYRDNIRTVTLASRGNLCINDMVMKLGNLSLVNDRCLDMQKASSKPKVTAPPERKRTKKNTAGKCPFYRPQAMESMAMDILTEVQDIEQVVHHARKEKTCPYYSSRYATPDAELVLIPYNILLQKTTREACKLDLKGSVVIIDEAHNLLETISDLHSVCLKLTHLKDVQRVLGEYYNRYHARMSTKNILYIKQVLHVLKCFISYLTGPGKEAVQSDVSTMCTVPTLLDNTGLGAINLFKVASYLEQSQIALKVNSFAKKATVALEKKSENLEAAKLSSFIHSMKKRNSKQFVPMVEASTEQAKDCFVASENPMITLQEFIHKLSDSSRDGQVLVHKAKCTEHSFLKYLLLSPANNFRDIVSEARSIILAGGTMQPTSEFVDQLLIPAGVSPERVMHFSCGHVVAKDNLSVIALGQGPTGRVFEFTFKNKMDPEMIDELGRVLGNVTRVVPGGIVCFFPSYEYERAVSQRWKETGVLEKISTKKHIFHEPLKSSELENTLAQYGQCAKATSGSEPMTGAILFSVVGGKMSEGINFSDDMGRCIVMVGLPFPNAKAPEMSSKMEYLTATYSRTDDGRTAGQAYYESVCMKAVNQSIGRAIRHKDDYAVILLLDHRYQKENITKALPAWMQDSLTLPTKFAPAFAAIQHFFRRRKNLQSVG